VNEKEIKDHIKKLTVQIKTPQERGTGVLIEYQKQYYILTVYHVIFGKKSIAHKVESDEIKVIFENKAEIYIEKIIPKKGLVLLEIDNRNLPFQNSITLLFDNVPYDKKLYIRGFPSKFNQAHNFEAKCNDDAINRESFQIAMRDMTSDTSGDDAIEYMRGVSGSGVFYAKGDRLYLVGLVNALADQAGTFNAIVCTNLYGLGVIKERKKSSFNYLWLALSLLLLGGGIIWVSDTKSKIVEKPKEPILEKKSISKKIFLSINEGEYKQIIENHFNKKLIQKGFIVTQNESISNGYRINITNNLKQKESKVYGENIIKSDCSLSYKIIDIASENIVYSGFEKDIISKFDKVSSARDCMKHLLEKIDIQ